MSEATERLVDKITESLAKGEVAVEQLVPMFGAAAVRVTVLEGVMFFVSVGVAMVLFACISGVSLKKAIAEASNDQPRDDVVSAYTAVSVVSGVLLAVVMFIILLGGYKAVVKIVEPEGYLVKQILIQ